MAYTREQLSNIGSQELRSMTEAEKAEVLKAAAELRAQLQN